MLNPTNLFSEAVYKSLHETEEIWQIRS